MYELEISEEGRVISRRRLVRPETVVGGHDACDVCLTSLPQTAQVVLRHTAQGIRIFGGEVYLRFEGRPVFEGWLWVPETSLAMGATKLELRPYVSRTVTHEETVRVTEALQLRAGAVTAALQTDRSTVIGASHADLNLVHGSVAARHAKVEWRGGAYYVVDLDSGKETCVNGRLVPPGTAGARLRVGDQLSCGDAVVEVEFQAEVFDEGLVGESTVWRAVRTQIRALANEALVSVVGEPGTGKSLVAHALHAASGRQGQMVVLNGAALRKEMARSALFGHEKGAFSDAVARRDGALAAATDGTLFIGEAGRIDDLVQTQMLRVVEQYAPMRVGEMKASSESEEARTCFVFAVRSAALLRMRTDFQARLGKQQIRLPPLRARGEDVILIAEHRLATLDRRMVLSRDAKQALRAHRWPGNVRELLNTIERSVAELPKDATVLEASDLRWTAASDVAPTSDTTARGPFSEALVAHDGNVSAAARAMNTSRFLFEKGIAAEGVSVKQLRAALKARRTEALRSVVLEEGGFAAAGRKLGMTGMGVRVAVGEMENISREAIQMRLQSNAGDVAAAAEDLGVSVRALRRRMERLGVFEGEVRGPLGWLVLEGGREAQRHPVSSLGFAVGTRTDNEVILEEGPALLALVVQRGERLGLRVFRGEGVRAAGGLLLHAATLDLDAGEVVEVGATRLYLESASAVSAVARGRAESVVLHVGQRRTLNPKGVCTVGSDETRCDVVVDDPHVSGAHLRVFEAGGAWHVRDLSSKNGTYVRGDLHRAGPVRVPTPLRIGNSELRLEWAKPRVHPKMHGFVGSCAQMMRVYAALEHAKDARTVLVTGETGTGKELAARAMHEIWGGGPLVVVNCGGVADELLHNELMGHVKGAFTGAKEDRAGLIAQADGGTLFLDELGDMSLQLQGQILWVLTEGAYTPIGEDRPRRADVRIVAATNRNLPVMLASGAFDVSLYHRFVHEIRLPPLRERGDEDLFALAAYLLEGMDGWRAAPDAFEVLRGRRWELNVREVRNVLQAAVRLAAQEGAVEVMSEHLRAVLL